MGMGGEMGGMGGMAGGGLTMGDIYWSDYDYRMPERLGHLMIHWAFLGARELPSEAILLSVVESVGDSATGTNAMAKRLKADRENANLTLETAKAFVRALERGRALLSGLNLTADPTLARALQQNQYLADYLLARAETLPGGGALAPQIREQQKSVAQSFRYESPTDLVPLLAEHFPGMFVYYNNMGQRLRVEQQLNVQSVKDPLAAAGFWVKMMDLNNEDVITDKELLKKLQEEVGSTAADAPAIVLCGQDLFQEDVIALASQVSGAAAGMGMGAEMGGMPGGMMGGGMPGGMGMGAGMPGMMGPGGAMGGQAAGAAGMEEPTDWLPGLSLTPAGAAPPTTQAGVGMGMAGGMDMGGMPGMMGGMGAEGGMGTTAAAAPSGGMAIAGYDFRMPSRLARLMIHWSFVGPQETPPDAVMSFAVSAVGDPASGIVTRAAALKRDQDNAGLNLALARSYIDALEKGRALLPSLGLNVDPRRARMVQQNQYMADYLLARVVELQGNSGQAVRTERQRLIPSFRYESASELIPVLCTEFPGLVGFYQDMRQRMQLEQLLDAQSVSEALNTNRYWVKLIQVADTKQAANIEPFAAVTSPELEAEIKSFPSFVLCGRDPFVDEEQQQFPIALAGAVSGQAAGGMGMGMGMGMGADGGMMGGMPGMLPGGMPGAPGGMMGGEGGAAAGAQQGMEKITDWLPGAILTPRGAKPAAASPGGEMGGMMGAGMPGG